jgi:HSP20 family protein
MFNRQETADRQQQQFKGHRGCGGFGKRFGSMFGDAVQSGGHWKNAFNSFGNRKAVNIEETDTTFIISLYAAGLQKNNFGITITGDVLTIKYTASEDTQRNPKQYAHVEYQPSYFERSFQLNGKVLTESISATYVDGVLEITLPKNPETNKPAHEVKVD